MLCAFRVGCAWNGVVSIFGQWGEIGQLCGAHVVWWENRHVVAGGESARNGTTFGVEWEIGGPRVWCVPVEWGAGGWG